MGWVGLLEMAKNWEEEVSKLGEDKIKDHKENSNTVNNNNNKGKVPKGHKGWPLLGETHISLPVATPPTLLASWKSANLYVWSNITSLMLPSDFPSDKNYQWYGNVFKTSILGSVESVLYASLRSTKSSCMHFSKQHILGKVTATIEEPYATAIASELGIGVILAKSSQ
ncbi:hypothetical protein VNO77_02099 [Canavalia gladiata]|uniref:Uncharacterized protein n=1 Tax=Canavalia gladiata TaxID=3824 RepID=A0AAN9R5L4_CANGL